MSSPETDYQLLAEQHLEGLNVLLDVTNKLAHEQELSRILEIVTDAVCEAHQCERASLFLYDEDRHDLHTEVVTELEISEIRREFGESITGWVAEHRKLLNVPDAYAEERWDRTIDQQTGFRTETILACPIISVHDDKLLGVLQVLNKKEGVFSDLDEQLIQAFAAHAGAAIERQQLLEEVHEKAQLQSAIDLGREIQSSFLPTSMPIIPQYELATWWEPAESVSGDYYDFVKLPDNRLGVIVADVSGHGVGPSLIMASFRAMFRVLARNRSRITKLFRLLVDSIYPDLHEGRFITAIFVAICPATHTLNYTNAAHAPALYLDRKTGTIHNLKTTNLPIGVIPDMEVKAGTRRKIQAGDLILLATDGLIELRNKDDEMFGNDRLKQIILENQELPATQLRDLIKQKIHEFHPDPNLPDDITLLLIERKSH
ncbi:MAG: SpoIIE family protein phosphatase [Planctomycetaceae bacterium]|nr:SpoIIE family protein phosphatase [Planctomycetaceae bacterium]